MYDTPVKIIRNGILLGIIIGICNMMLHAGLHLDHDAMHAPCEVCVFSGVVVQPKPAITQTILLPIVGMLLVASVCFAPFIVLRVRTARSPPLPLLRII